AWLTMPAMRRAPSLTVGGHDSSRVVEPNASDADAPPNAPTGTTAPDRSPHSRTRSLLVAGTSTIAAPSHVHSQDGPTHEWVGTAALSPASFCHSTTESSWRASPTCCRHSVIAPSTASGATVLNRAAVSATRR